ncbi:deoxyribose-phosphate aldolase [Sphaerochaeta halotolerans]|jgi:deoxyribose-phosphate aldolase|uniref:Deoxyribose-phosphate aldolase n=1 Tax=Sphaerochaeta halotolerans TaxID=2293840 RepID=A0A372MJX7_9SPIR|nr:deoxyribose-phosphate aldolase [Sphaerochaeta halotolerans]MBG0768117.1 deoxyribose-phosphate aldolase [Spirochaetaceae bacterium]MDK2859574.1 deoxyribose-phosphate aldolase [Sphaerochaeta sp.]MDN5334337.1 deoxyribose-phosphate aldolase [Sphaerochaeta sp.]MXI87250.1 deoxyribose-phosphate aldolase [Sphaerochaeta halotolerans]RFU96044.1 deoxyribose-phosphate aldolase [Sphaerochaeta halotolerans]
MKQEDVAKYIDHTVLAATATRPMIEKLCKEADQYHFASVCVNSCWVPLCAKLLGKSDVKVCTVVGFPLGAMATESKAFEAKTAVRAGAEEVDMVINIGFLKNHDDDLVQDDITAVKKACGNALLKVIIETCLLNEEEIVRACRLAKASGADFVKTSTGFSTGGATAKHIALMRKTVGPQLGVKASGGVRTYEDAIAMIEAGATRIGASSGIAIVEGSHGAN